MFIMQVTLPDYTSHATDQRLGLGKRPNGEQARHSAIHRKKAKGESGEWGPGGDTTPQKPFGNKEAFAWPLALAPTRYMTMQKQQVFGASTSNGKYLQLLVFTFQSLHTVQFSSLILSPCGLWSQEDNIKLEK
jgi:hypothetical protein